jgi:hypothetical protein
MLRCLSGGPCSIGLVVTSATNGPAEFARECMRLACETKDERIREQLILLARQWLLLLLEEELSVALGPPMGCEAEARLRTSWPMSAPLPVGRAKHRDYTARKKHRAKNVSISRPSRDCAEQRQEGSKARSRALASIPAPIRKGGSLVAAPL